MTAFRGRRAGLATRHGKLAAIGPVLADRLGLMVEPVDADTDRLGTFVGDVARPGDAVTTALAKARLALAAGYTVGLASEGTFGPDPALPFLPLAVEHVAIIDTEIGISLVETRRSRHTNFAHAEVAPGEDIQAFLGGMGFPDHAIVVRAADWRPSDPYRSGIQDIGALQAALSWAAALGATGRVRLDTDMRAHMNPTRMREIGVVAEALAERLASACPACFAPGFGRVDVVRGLRCEDCGTPTALVRAEIWGCVRCEHREERPATGHQWADAAHCPQCNP